VVVPGVSEHSSAFIFGVTYVNYDPPKRRQYFDQPLYVNQSNSVGNISLFAQLKPIMVAYEQDAEYIVLLSGWQYYE
jgi:hypothetical protein